MQATLRGVSGPPGPVEVMLETGRPVTVGRRDQATVRVPQDASLSGLHFTLQLEDGQVLLRDLGSTNGTFVNGTRVQACTLNNGDTIAAGQNIFRLDLLTELHHPAAVLATELESLYAILDAAREPRVLELLRLSGASFYSLHQGKAAAEMEVVSPYLVPLGSQPALLQQIVGEGWAKAWGIFFTCREPAAAVWRHLSGSLMVTLEGEEIPVYFRFYDPRVLRQVLPILDAQQLLEFAGPITRFLMEDEEPDGLLCFTIREGTGKIERITVAPVAG